MILHIDMDAFFAAVEVLDFPELAGRALIVGGDPRGRGVVATASYEARKFGVHSAMPMAQAVRLCPQAIIRRVRMERYQQLSAQIRAIFARYTPEIEPLSLDEAFLDVSASERLFGPAETVGRRIQAQIADELGLGASVGVAPSKFVAKIASDIDKPHGFVHVPSGQVQAFLDPLPVGRLWGVGKATGAVFDKLGISTIGQVRRQSPELMQRYFGNMGGHLLELANGIDPRRVISEQRARSISNETTFAADVTDVQVLRGKLMEQCEQVAGRLRYKKLKGRTVQLKLRFPDFRTITRAQTLPEPTDHTDMLWQAGWQLFTENWKAAQGVRLLGIGVSQLTSGSEPNRQPDLFSEHDEQQLQAVDSLTDDIQSRFGPLALQRGTRVRTSDKPASKTANKIQE